MNRLLLPLLLLGIMLSASADDSFLFVLDGRAITNGAPVHVKALKTRYAGSFFWFSIDGKSYIARDPDVLRRLKDVYAPLFNVDMDFTAGEQSALLGEQMTVLEEQRPRAAIAATRFVLRNLRIHSAGSRSIAGPMITATSYFDHGSGASSRSICGSRTPSSWCVP